MSESRVVQNLRKYRGRDRAKEKEAVREEIDACSAEYQTKKTALILPLRRIIPAVRPGEEQKYVGYHIRGVIDRHNGRPYHEVVFAVDERGRESTTHMIGEPPWKYREDPIEENRGIRDVRIEDVLSDIAEVVQEEGHEHLTVNVHQALIGFQVRARG